jgi:alkanesulfonate monooxygenase SsuD/methylene tetrahydromethanopterin reductase-like flavin-dependent oxidoreductase (luciferase family)
LAIQFHIGILPNRPAAESVALGQAAERLDYAGVWVADSHSVMRGAFEILAVLAARTRRIALATGVTHTVTRHPAVIANSIATLDELSGGRAILGIGVGESAVHNLGLEPEKLSVFASKLQVIRALLRGEEAEYEGARIRMPWSTSRAPLVLACSGPKSLQLAGRIADGVLFQVGADPSLVRYALDNIRHGAESAGRSPAGVKLYMRLACSVGGDRDAARAAVRGYASIAAGTVFRTVPREYFSDGLWNDLARFKAQYDYAEHGRNEARHAGLLTERIVDAVAIAGTPEEAVPRLRQLAGLGIAAFVWPAAMPDPLPYLEAFSRQVMPHLR